MEDSEEAVEELDTEDAFPLAQRAIASSTTAAIAPSRPPPKNDEDEELEDDDVETDDFSESVGELGGKGSPRYMSESSRSCTSF